MGEVAVAERERLRIASHRARVRLQLFPVPLDPFLRARAARQPVAGLHDAIHHRLRDHGHVVLVGIGNAGTAGHPDVGHLRRARIDRHVLELVVAAAVARVGLREQQRDGLDDLVGAPAALLDARARHLVLARVPARADTEDVPVVRQVAERRDLLREHDRMADGQDEDAGRDLHLRRERRGVGEGVERLEPRVAVETRRGQQVVDDPERSMPCSSHFSIACRMRRTLS